MAVITRFGTEVSIVGRYPPTKTMHAGFDGKLVKAAPGTSFQFVKVVTPLGTHRDIEVCDLRADGGAAEIDREAKAAPLIK